MSKAIFSFLTFFLVIPAFSQNPPTEKAYHAGEWFKFRIHYGWFNASHATLSVTDETFNGKPVHHVVGKGNSTGLLDVFFKVDDNYETYIEKETGLPLKFIRKINEGGHKKHRVILFDPENQKAEVNNVKHKRIETYTTKPNVQDMMSVLYYLRNHINHKTIQKGDEIIVDLFFDYENYKFRTVFLGRERIKTKFGKIDCLKFRPYVQSGRVFDEEESLTFWVSDDANKIPLKIKAKLAVGSLEADLDKFKGLRHPFRIYK